MATIIFTITNPAIARLKQATAGLHPIPLDENGDPQFTTAEWAKEYYRRLMKSEIRRWEDKVAKDAITPSVVDDGDIT